MAGQRSSRQEEERQVESLHRLHRPEQIMSKGSVPGAAYRQTRGCHSGAPAYELHGCILRLQLDTHASWRPGEDILHDV